MNLSRLVTTPLVMLIRLYQMTLGPFMSGQCRFHPTCSNYALEALQTHGPFRGVCLTARRLARCHPFHPGGYDPVPPTDPPPAPPAPPAAR